MNDFITTTELGEILRVKEQTLRSWRCKGIGPAFCRLGRGPGARVVYRRADVEAWLDAHRVATADTSTSTVSPHV